MKAMGQRAPGIGPEGHRRKLAGGKRGTSTAPGLLRLKRPCPEGASSEKFGEPGDSKRIFSDAPPGRVAYRIVNRGPRFPLRGTCPRLISFGAPPAQSGQDAVPLFANRAVKPRGAGRRVSVWSAPTRVGAFDSARVRTAPAGAGALQTLRATRSTTAKLNGHWRLEQDARRAGRAREAGQPGPAWVLGSGTPPSHGWTPRRVQNGIAVVNHDGPRHLGVPQARPRIAQQFIAGFGGRRASSPAGTEEFFAFVLPSLRDSTGSSVDPAINCWAIFGRPCGTGGRRAGNRARRAGRAREEGLPGPAWVLGSGTPPSPGWTSRRVQNTVHSMKPDGLQSLQLITW